MKRPKGTPLRRFPPLEDPFRGFGAVQILLFVKALHPPLASPCRSKERWLDAQRQDGEDTPSAVQLYAGANFEPHAYCPLRRLRRQLSHRESQDWCGVSPALLLRFLHPPLASPYRSKAAPAGAVRSAAGKPKYLYLLLYVFCRIGLDKRKRKVIK